MCTFTSMSTVKAPKFKIRGINLNYLFDIFAKDHIIKTGGNRDIIFANKLYWTFRNFIFKNYIIPNEIDVEFFNWNDAKKKILYVFAFKIFGFLPQLIKPNERHGWIGWSLNIKKLGQKPKVRREKINIFSTFDRFLCLHVKLTNSINDCIDKDFLWNRFKDWWTDRTGRKVPPSKKKFLDYAEDVFFDKEIKITRYCIGWDKCIYIDPEE